MKCRECGRLLLDHEKFCVGCGTPREVSAPAAPPLPAEVHCESCGASLTTEDRFCQSCGARVGGPTVTEGPAERVHEPAEAQLKSTDAPDPKLAPTPAAAERAPRKRANSAMYQLFGLIFVLIAGGYFAYSYFSGLRYEGVTPTSADETALAQDEAPPPPGEFGSVQSPAPGENQRVETETPTVPPYDPSNNLPADGEQPKALSSTRPSTRPQSTTPARQEPPASSEEVAVGRLDPRRQPTPPPPPASASFPNAEPSPTNEPTTPANSLPPRNVVPASPPTPLQPDVPPATKAPPQARGGEVLMPGSQAWKRAQPPPRTSTPPAISPPSNAPAPKPAAENGTIYWTGKLRKNQVIVIENGEANSGFADGNHFTGIPIDVHLPSPAVRLVERPTAENSWKRVSFQCLRTTNQSVTINIQWNLLR